jgi:hypothetical protein
MKKVAKTLALVMGAVLLLIGLLSFFSTGLFGPGGMMIRYQYVNYLYLASGALLLGFSTMGESWAAFGLYSVAFLQVLVAGLGYMALDRTNTATLFDTLRLTQADLVFHVILAISLAICGKMNTARQQVIWD